MNSKELFLKNKPLRESWAAVVHSDWFKEVITHARAEASQRVKNLDELNGAFVMENVLFELCDEEAPAYQYPRPGLRHDIDKPAPTLKTEPAK